MTLRGEVRGGVIVLEGGSTLEEGTIVQVEPIEESAPKLRRGSAAAILQAAGGWAESREEMDEALEYLRQLKQEEVRQELERLKKNGAQT